MSEPKAFRLTWRDGAYRVSVPRLLPNDGDSIEVVPAEAYDRVRGALAKADAEVTALADALRAAGVPAVLVQKIATEARPRGES